VNVAMLYSRLQMGQFLMDCIKLKLSDIISLYKKKDSERRQFVSLDILYYYYLLYPVSWINIIILLFFIHFYGDSFFSGFS